MPRCRYLPLLLPLLLHCVGGGFLGESPDGCDTEAAAACEYEDLKCRIFTGPAGDSETLCKCGMKFFGECLRLAGCQTSVEVSGLGERQTYMRKCAAHVIANDCPDTTMCSINCASETLVDRSAVKIVPFNNYGKYWLRIRSCVRGVNLQKFSQYNVVQAMTCDDSSDRTEDHFIVCSRFVPPLHFTHVAIPEATTYVEVDSCELRADGTYYCHVTDEPKPVRLYGNAQLFPRTFDVAKTNISVCSSDADCVGSFCDTHFRPPVCSPKTEAHVEKSGRYYFSDPFG